MTFVLISTISKCEENFNSHFPLKAILQSKDYAYKWTFIPNFKLIIQNQGGVNLKTTATEDIADMK